MTDARWLDIEDDLASSTKHFRNAIAIYQEGLAADDSLPAYKGRMSRRARNSGRKTRDCRGRPG